MGTLVQENITLVNSKFLPMLLKMEKCFQHLRTWDYFSYEEKLKYVFLFETSYCQNSKLI